jgi:hypothetical protein
MESDGKKEFHKTPKKLESKSCFGVGVALCVCKRVAGKTRLKQAQHIRAAGKWFLEVVQKAHQTCLPLCWFCGQQQLGQLFFMIQAISCLLWQYPNWRGT